MLKNVPINVPIYVRYDGDKNDYLPEKTSTNRISYVVIPEDIKAENWEKNTIGDHMTNDNLLIGFSDGKMFHILNKTSRHCNLPLAIAKEEYKYSDENDKGYRGTLGEFVKVYNTIKNSGAKFTIDWRDDSRELDAKTYEAFDEHRKKANLPFWEAGDYKRFPTFIWEVASIPFKNLTFEKNAIASEERDMPYFNYLFALKNNKIN